MYANAFLSVTGCGIENRGILIQNKNKYSTIADRQILEGGIAIADHVFFDPTTGLVVGFPFGG